MWGKEHLQDPHTHPIINPLQNPGLERTGGFLWPAVVVGALIFRCFFQIIIFEVWWQAKGTDLMHRVGSLVLDTLVDNHIQIKRVIFVSLVATRPTCSIQIIQLVQIPINNAITTVIFRLPAVHSFLHHCAYLSFVVTASHQHPKILGIVTLVLGSLLITSHQC